MCSVPHVHHTRSMRNERLQRLPDQLVARVTEEGLSLMVHEMNEALGVDCDDRILRGAEQSRELCLDLVSFRGVTHCSRHQYFIVGLYRCERQADGESAAV